MMRGDARKRHDDAELAARIARLEAADDTDVQAAIDRAVNAERAKAWDEGHFACHVSSYGDECCRNPYEEA